MLEGVGVMNWLRKTTLSGVFYVAEVHANIQVPKCYAKIQVLDRLIELLYLYGRVVSRWTCHAGWTAIRLLRSK